jgi:signal transduction histidine kinase
MHSTTPSSTESPSSSSGRSVEAALIEKIEELSLLRALNDRLSRAPNFASACRALVDLVWEDRGATSVAYFSLDGASRTLRLEAVAPGGFSAAEHTEAFHPDDEPFATLLRIEGPALVDQVGGAPWHRPPARPAARDASIAARGVLAGVPTSVRGTTTGLIVAYVEHGDAHNADDLRLLAIIATSAAMALDVARSDERDEFLAMLRHDINNPVSVALGYTEMIIDHLRTADDRDALYLADSVVESLKSVADLVSNYLHMSAIDRGIPWLDLRELDLLQLAEEVVAGFRPWAAEKGIEISLDGAAPPVRADRRQMARVLSNLVSNAVKYTPGPGRVTVSCRRAADGVELVVRDTGFGLRPEDLPLVFTKYARLHRDKRIPGTGLGLYISRAIVLAHGGDISVESEAGVGSAFTLRLPRETADAAPDGSPRLPDQPPDVPASAPSAASAVARSAETRRADGSPATARHHGGRGEPSSASSRRRAAPANGCA